MENIESVINILSSRNNNISFNSNSKVLTVYGSHRPLVKVNDVLNSLDYVSPVLGTSKDKQVEKWSNKVIIDLTSLKFKIVYDWGKQDTENYDLKWFSSLTWKECEWYKKSGVVKGHYFIEGLRGSHIGTYGSKFTTQVEPVLVELKSIISDYLSYQEEILKQEKIREQSELDKKEKEFQRLEEERIKKLDQSKNLILSDLDQDGNGVLDIIEGGDFMRLLKKHQPRIKEIDRTYIQRFIQVSNFIESQSESLQEVFTRLNQVNNQEELESLVGLLNNHKHTYEQILFHSLNMIVSLVDEDDLTFYEIYETFDKLNVFDSGWEKQVSQKLSDINLNISDLMYSVDRMNVQIVNGLNKLSYITEESNRNLVGRLGEIDSSIRVNTLLTGIQSFQLFQINKNTKSLRS